MEICSKEKCTGCGMCETICPKNAIELKPDARGFLHPLIDQEKCIQCNLCVQKCTENNPLLQISHKQKVYAAMNRNKLVRKNSTSGGIFSLLAQEIIRQGGLVFGIKWDNKFNTCYCCVDNTNDLDLLYGSKYIQCVPNKIYKKVKQVLNEGKTVLFSSTPCQVSALNNYLKKPYQRLYTVDLVCHGVPSYDIFEKHLKEITDGNLDLVEKVSLRYKDPCWSYSSVKIDLKGRKNYLKLTMEDPFFNLFNFNYSLRESCHNCRYTTVERQGDITLSDFWGYVPKNFKTRDFDRGISCVLVNNEKGEDLFDKVKRSAIYEESNVDDAKRANKSLSKPFEAPCDVADFWNDYEKGISITELNAKYIVKPFVIPKFLWLRRIKRKYKWIFRR